MNSDYFSYTYPGSACADVIYQIPILLSLIHILRVSVKDKDKVKDVSYFNANGAHGLVKNGFAIQVIIGLDVPSVREEFEKLL